MKLATTTGDFAQYTADQELTIRYLHRSGFKYIDYSFCTDYDNRSGIYADDWQEYVERLKKLPEELGIEFVQSHAPMGRPIRSGHGSDFYNSFVEDTKRAIEVSGMLGIPNIIIHSDYKFRLSKEDAFKRNYEFFHDLLPTAEKWGINILIENFNKMEKEELYWVDNATDLLAMIEMIDHPLCHACWDIGHANMQETSQLEELRLLGSHVRALHVQDTPGCVDSHFAPFFGIVNFDMIMHALKEIGYKGCFTMEACNMLTSAEKRRPFEQDTRLLRAPLSVKLKAEELLYEIGKAILEAYGEFEG